jgi:glutathione S-transferase
MLKIFEMLHSPYCIPITMILKAAGQDYESAEIPNWDRSKVMELTDGEYYQVPVLVHGDRLIFEDSDTSLTVARYVNEHFSRHDLFPGNISGIHEVLIEHIESGIEGLTFKLCDVHYIPGISQLADRTAVIRHKERRFGRGCLDEWRRDEDALRSELMAALNGFKGTLTEKPFLFGDHPVYADYALAGVIGNYTYPAANKLDPDQDWLRDWLNRL